MDVSLYIVVINTMDNIAAVVVSITTILIGTAATLLTLNQAGILIDNVTMTSAVNAIMVKTDQVHNKAIAESEGSSATLLPRDLCKTDHQNLCARFGGV